MTYHIPLDAAHLCLDCESLSDSHRYCPACSSANLLPLAPVLDRETCATVGSSYPSICMEAI